MKKEIKLCISIFVMIVAVFILPTATIFASSSQYGYIDSEIQFKSEYLNFEGLKFYDNSNDSTRSFGIIGQVENTTSNDISIETTIYFYNKEYDTIATSKGTMEISSNSKTSYIQMAKVEIIKEGYSASDIYSYKIYIKENKIYNNDNSYDINLFNKYDYSINK